jgi:hypothetical protein
MKNKKSRSRLTYYFCKLHDMVSEMDTINN